jgi:TonB family protein
MRRPLALLVPFAIFATATCTSRYARVMEMPACRIRPDSAQADTAAVGSDSAGIAPRFVPFGRRPELLEPQRAGEIIGELYPRGLLVRRIGGTAVVWAFVRVDGSTERVHVTTPSGHVAIDRAAVEAASRFHFIPAVVQKADEPACRVPVWVSLPIIFDPKKALPDSVRFPTPPPG